MEQEERKLYKIILQKGGITISSTTTDEMTYDEAKVFAEQSIFGVLSDKASRDAILVLPITTRERWDSGYINYCPRCGANLADADYERFAEVFCFDCDAEMDIHILHIEGDEE